MVHVLGAKSQSRLESTFYRFYFETISMNLLLFWILANFTCPYCSVWKYPMENPGRMFRSRGFNTNTKCVITETLIDARWWVQCTVHNAQCASAPSAKRGPKILIWSPLNGGQEKSRCWPPLLSNWLTIFTILII